MAVKRIFLSNRQEWLKARSGRIGGSDASAVIGLNPYLNKDRKSTRLNSSH